MTTLAVLRATAPNAITVPKISIIRLGENTAEAMRQAVRAEAAAGDAAASAADALATALGVAAGLRPANVLFDPFAEVVSLDKTFGGVTHFSVTPTFNTSSVNNPLSTPAMTSTAAAIYRRWPRESLPVKAGDQLTVAALSYGDASGRNLLVYFTDAAGTPVASGSFVGSNVATAGVITLSQTVTVPAAAYAFLLVGVAEAGGNAPHEVFGFAAAPGAITPAFTRAAPMATWADALPLVPNQLFAPFAEELVGFTTDDTGRGLVTGTPQAVSVNSPWGRGSILNSGGTSDRHIYASTDLPFKAGDVLCIRVASYNATSHSFFWQDAANVTIGASPFMTRTVSGTAEEIYWLTVPAGAVTRLKVRASGAGNELTGVAACRGYARPQFGNGPAPAWWVAAKITAQAALIEGPTNYFPDPFFRQLAAGVRTQDGFPRVGTLSSGNPDATLEAAPALSPWARTVPKAIKIPSGRGTVDFGVFLDRMALKVGDALNIMIGLVHSQQVNCIAFLRHGPLGTVFHTTAVVGTASVAVDTYTQITIPLVITQPIYDAIIDGDVLLIRVLSGQTANASGVYVVATEVTKGPVQITLNPRRSLDADQRGITQRTRREGSVMLRELRRKLAMLRTGGSALAVVGVFGDSWSFNHRRYVAKLLDLLRSQIDITGARLPFGGPGWTDFGGAGTTPTPLAFGGGNTLPDTYTLRQTGTWAGSQNSPSPGIYAFTATSAASFEETGPASPQIVTAKLLYEKTVGASFRWRWGSYVSGDVTLAASYSFGAWTTEGSSTAVPVAVVDISAGIPSGVGWMFQVEWVAGTVKLFGDFKFAANGVVVSKMASSGSQVATYTARVAADWQASIAEGELDLAVICFGTNDQGATITRPTFTTNLRELATRIRAAFPNADLLFLAPVENGRTSNTYPMSYYADDMRRVAREFGGAFVDPQDAFGWPPSSYMDGGARPLFAAADLLHPEPTTGGAALTGEVLGVIVDG